MNKTRKFFLTGVALAVFTANSAFAGGINLVKTDAVTVNMNGDIDLRILNKDDKEGTQIEANFDDMDFTFTYKISKGLKFIAETDWTMEYESSEGLENDGAWVGFETDYGLLRAGFQTNSFDPLGIDSAEILDNGMSSGDIDGGGTNRGSSLVYEFERDNYWLSATYTLPQQENEYDADADDDVLIPEVMQLVGMYEVGDLSMGAGVGKTITYTDDDDVKYESVYTQAQAEYKMGSLTLSILAGYEEQQKVNVTTKTLEFDTQYKLNKKITFMGGFDILSQDYDDLTLNSKTLINDDVRLTYFGTTYKFNKYVKLYAEVGTKKGSMVRYGKGKQESWDQKIAALELGVDF